MSFPVRVFASAVLCTLLAFPSFSATLREVLADHRVAGNSESLSDLDSDITGYATGTDDRRFGIAYYHKRDGAALEPLIHLAVYDKHQATWRRGAFDKSDHEIISGSIMAFAFRGDHVYLSTHINPSAGATLIFDNRLEFVDSFHGGILAIFPDNAVVFANNSVHFAPTHFVKVSFYDPVSKSTRELYPLKPYQEVRLAHIAKVREAYARRGEDWFRDHNHHMDPERFNCHLRGDVVLNDQTDAIALVVLYANKDYLPDEDAFKFTFARSLSRRIAGYGTPASPAEYGEAIIASDSWYEELYRRRERIPDAERGNVLSLFGDHPRLFELFKAVLDNPKDANHTPRWHFIRLDPAWGTSQTWRDIHRVTADFVYTRVAVICRNVHSEDALAYRELREDLVKRQLGDIPMQEWLEPANLDKLFAGTSAP